MLLFHKHRNLFSKATANLVLLLSPGERGEKDISTEFLTFEHETNILDLVQINNQDPHLKTLKFT